MATPELLLHTLKRELRRLGLTYRELASRAGVSESTVKRLFSRGDMPLSRLHALCQAARLPLSDLMRQAADAEPQAQGLTTEQESRLVADPRLLLVAVCCLGQWPFEGMVSHYALEPAQVVHALVQLDRLGLIELHPLNRYTLRVARTFRWLPDGPVQRWFRRHVAPDYFDGRFDGPGEALMFVHARLSPRRARELALQCRQLAAQAAAAHQEEQRLGGEDREGYTLLVGLRSWEFSAFTAMRRAA